MINPICLMCEKQPAIPYDRECQACLDGMCIECGESPATCDFEELCSDCDFNLQEAQRLQIGDGA